MRKVERMKISGTNRRRRKQMRLGESMPQVIVEDTFKNRTAGRRWPFLLLLLFVLLAIKLVQAQVSWTPIYVDTSSQVDLWTIKDRGCECPDDKTSKNCACCVQPGGCLCTFHSNKCAQCGLEDVCQRFCNVSISSWRIASKSSLSWLQIKSPSLQGPTSCWWRIESAPGQRIEVQIHRLVTVGSFDNSSAKCSKGFVQFSTGDTILPSSQAIQLCGENSRFSPPIVMFADQGFGTLLLKLEGRTTRSQLLAYVSFSSADDPVVGDPTKGGRPSSHSACDWTYDNCWTTQDCILTSPGYPGISAPYRKCRYFLSGNATTSRIRLIFNVLQFSNKQPRKCSSHHMAIWKTTAQSHLNLSLSTTPAWKVLCQNVDDEDDTKILKNLTIVIESTHAILEYNSGPTISPFLFNGFHASVQFIQDEREVVQFPYLPPFVSNYYNINVIPTQISSTMASMSTTSSKPPFLYYETTTSSFRFEDGDKKSLSKKVQQSYVAEGVYPITCGHIFEGDTTRGHVFRLLVPKDLTLRPTVHISSFGTYEPVLKKAPPGPFKCQIEFRGRATDIVQFAVFNYKFRGTNCSTLLEIYDMDIERTLNRTDRLLGRLCGPTGNEVKRFTSSHSRLALVTYIFPHEELAFGTEFLEGAFRFHDESIEGTVKPMSSCEVVYYGVTSTLTGIISGPPDSPLLLLSTYPLVCAYTFIPSLFNQSVTVMINGAGHDTIAIALPNSMYYCRTICGNSGCWCEAKYTPLEQIDHLLILSGISPRPISCLCGYFKDILPLAYESHLPLTLIYHATKVGREFSYSIGYQFKNKVTCTNFTISPPSASKRWKDILGPSIQYNNRYNGNLQYAYFQCIWPISIPTRYKLIIDFISEENDNDCRTWNLTLWTGHYSIESDLLFTFCPKDGRKEFQIPENIQFTFLKLLGVSMRPPQFDIRWRYVDVMLGSGFLTERIVTGESCIIMVRHGPLDFVILALVIRICQLFLLSS